MQEQAFADAGQLLNDVRWYHSQNSNTMKNGRNPETHEVLDELKPEAVVKASQTAESLLAARGVNPFVIRFAALNIEELLLLTKEKNPDTRVWGELCLRVE